jgi:hypothetical protein
MEVVFKATDGTLFTSAQNCLDYERQQVQRCDWKGWDWGGKSTQKTDAAVLLYLCEDGSAESFLNAATNLNDEDVSGIDPGDTGWFYWDEGETRYRPIDDCLISVIKKASVS